MSNLLKQMEIFPLIGDKKRRALDMKITVFKESRVTKRYINCL